MGQQRLQIPQGATQRPRFLFRSADLPADEAPDLAGFTGQMRVARTRQADAERLVTIPDDGGAITIGGMEQRTVYGETRTYRVIDVTLPSDLTATLPAGELAYDLDVSDGGDPPVVYPVARDIVIVTARI